MLNRETWLAQTKLRPPRPRPDVVARPRLLARLREGGYIDRALERYRKEHRRRLFAHYLLNASYSTGGPLNPLQRLLFSAGTKDARTAQLIGEFGAGLIGVSELLSPIALGLALWANLATGRTTDTPEGQPSAAV